MTRAPTALMNRPMISKARRAAALETQRLSFVSWSEFTRNRSDKPRIKLELPKNRAQIPESNGRFLQLQVNQIVIAIDLVTQTRDRFELVIQFENFVQIANARRVNFEFEHVGELKTHLARCKTGLPGRRHPRRFLRLPRPCDRCTCPIMKTALRSLLSLQVLATAFLLGGCGGGGVSQGIQQARLQTAARIQSEPPGDYFIGRRYYKPDFKFWGYVRSPGQPWSTSRLVMLNEKQKLAPDRAANLFGSDNNYEYKLYGNFSGDKVYEPASNGEYPEFVLKNYEVLSTAPAPIFRSQLNGRSSAAVSRLTIEKPE